jgi:hypothetical protein
MPTDDKLLLSQFVAAFECLDNLTVQPYQSDRAALAALYAVLPGPFPPLYERLILAYRWTEEVDLYHYCLLPNPPGADFTGLLAEITRDRTMWTVLHSNGYIPFGRGTYCDYDPVCFDLRQRQKHHEYRIVQLDHEQILCYNRIKEKVILAASFRELMLKTIARV